MPVAQYREARAKFLETKEKQRKLHAKVKRLKNKNAPVHELLKWALFVLFALICLKSAFLIISFQEDGKKLQRCWEGQRRPKESNSGEVCETQQ